jgi:hypothetical protein
MYWMCTRCNSGSNAEDEVDETDAPGLALVSLRRDDPSGTASSARRRFNLDDGSTRATFVRLNVA